MPLQLDIKRKLTARSDRVKGIDQHPTEPWILCCLYNGDVNIWNYETQIKIKRFEVCDLPVRAAKFVTRKNLVITGSDDMMIRVFNYNTLERIHAYEAHSDYIRSIAVHPTMPYVISSSDDLLIKLWNWDTWACQQVFEGHSHYVMQIVINPKDTNTFASASLDRTVKVWQLGSAVANFTLDGHEKGVNCIDYYHGGDKPYLISGADDRCVKIWDYQNKTCVQSLEGHSQNVTAVAYHPELPLLMTGGEDGVIHLWHAGTYRLESSLHYGLERVWVIAAASGSHNVAVGYDEGTVMIKVGREEPAISMDVNGGKIVWAKHSEMQQANLKALREETEIKDGENLMLSVKDMGSCDLFPQTLAHNSNGRFVVVCGDDEYIIYTAMALRNKAFGAAQQFVWALDSSEYAILNNSSITVYKNFKERQTLKPAFNVEGIYGGHMLGVRSVSGTSLTFYDWEYLELIRRIEIQPRQVYWSESGQLACLTTDDSYYILRYKPSKVAEARAGKIPITEDGIEEAFEVENEISEKVKTGVWVGDCFIYNDNMNRLCYYVGGDIVTVCNLERTMYILGYVAREDRLYLNDKDLNIVSYSILLSVLQYQTAVMRKDFQTADKILPMVPLEERTRVAHFLEKQGFYPQALAVATEPDHKFDLSVPLGLLDIAKECAEELDAIEGPGSNSSARWTRLGNAASLAKKPGLTIYCYKKATDYGSLILYATSTGDKQLLQETAMLAEENGQCNVAFLSLFTLGKLDECLTILVACDRLAEASFFARTYVPSKLMEVSTQWREQLARTNPKAALSLADPENYDNLFPEYNESLKLEQFQREYNHEFHSKVENNPVNTAISNIDRNLAEEMAAAERSGAWTYRGASARASTVDLLSSPSTSTSSQISVLTAIPTAHAIPISPTIPISSAIPISPTIPISSAIPISPIPTSPGKPSTSPGIPTPSAVPTSSFIPTSPTRIAPNIPTLSSNTSSPLSVSPTVSSSPGASTSPSIPTPPTVPTTPIRSTPARSAPAVPDLSVISANLVTPLEPTRLATGIPTVQQNIPNEPELASGSSQSKEKPKAFDDKDNEFIKFMDELEKEIDEGLTDTFDDALDIADILEDEA